ncbi:MAG: SGNH/GDSL hydrolase family protein [bacterium]|nr:SGNH/GDSL hydrolase family protein [bacterium]
MIQPDIVLVGDSIRLGYEPHVIRKLPGRHVWGPQENCESTRFLLQNIETLVLSRLSSPAIVHLNAGAHDLRRWPAADYSVQVELDEYASNLVSIVGRLLARESVVDVVLATTTPVIDEHHYVGRWGRRLNVDVIAYNEQLTAVAAEHQLVVNDLYSAVDNCGFEAISTDGIHLTEPGAEHVGSEVATFLRAL